MKINYYGYFLKHTTEGTETLLDLRPFIKAFVASNNENLKRSFSVNGENLYLMQFPGASDIFVFIGTKSDELIKKINTQDLSVMELNELLEDNEKLGFSSYIIFKDNFFGYGSTILAPKITKFVYFINELLKYSNHEQLEFCVEILLSQATRSDALNLPVLGRTTIQVSKNSKIGRGLLSSFLGRNSDYIETLSSLGSIEITLKPSSKNGNIKEIVDSLINYDELSELDKFIVKAKDETSSAMIELYLIGKGAVSDFIKIDDEIRIPSLLEDRVSENLELNERIENYVQRESFLVEIDYSSLDFYFHPNNWNPDN